MTSKDEKLMRFLDLVPNANWRGNVPAVWNEQLREALSEGLVTVGFGGLLKLTDAGKLGPLRPAGSADEFGVERAEE